jgi:hypothetical protein
MSINDVLKICLVITLISLSFFILSSSGFLLHKIFNNAKIEVQVNGTYLQDEIVHALINSNVVETDNDN